MKQKPYAQEGSKCRWEASSKLMTMGLYCFENFTYALSQVLNYFNCIQICGPNWMGLRFKFPIIWFPEKEYRGKYRFTKKAEKKCSEELVSCKGYKNQDDKPENPFNFTHLDRISFDLDSYSNSLESIA